MDLKISEIRKLCNFLYFKVSFFQLLSDSEVNQFHEFSRDDSSACLVLDDGFEVTQPFVDAQQRFYDDLDLYIKFLQGLLNIDLCHSNITLLNLINVNYETRD